MMYRWLIVSLLIFCILGSGCVQNLDSLKGLIHMGSNPAPQTTLDPTKTLEITTTTTPELTATHQTATPSVPPTVPTDEPTPILPTLIPKSPDQKVTITISSDKVAFIFGEPVAFSGTCRGSDTVILKMYGPGKFLNGIELVREPVRDNDVWKYTWPSGAARPGVYTLYVTDPKNTVSERTSVTIQGSTVTIASENSAFTIGNPVRLSGTCVGSDTIVLTVYGPGQYAGGVRIAEPDVLSDKTWTYLWNPGSALLPGSYTISARDTHKTATASVTVIAQA